jgi:hypothetical protein
VNPGPYLHASEQLMAPELNYPVGNPSMIGMKSASKSRLTAVVCTWLPIFCSAKPSPSTRHPERSNTISDIRNVGCLTGKNAVVDTKRHWKIGGTDLGFPIYHEKSGTMHLMFGDTFLNNVDMTGMWRSNVMAVSRDFNLHDGLSIEDVHKGTSGEAIAVIEGHHAATKGEITKIPTGGIELAGTIYLFYMSVKEWGTHGRWTVNYNGVVRSADNGSTWERAHDLTWLCQDVGAPRERALELANQSVSLSEGGGSIRHDGRFAPSFAQIFPFDGKDGYIYIYGVPEGRGGGAKLGRVKKQEFTKFDAYEYFQGMEGDQPIFVKGRDGLACLQRNPDLNIIAAPCAELSVSYNPYLGKWMACHFMNNAISYRVADKPWGQWSAPETIITNREYPSLYGGLIHERYMAENGKKFYMILSQWMPIYNTSVIEVTLSDR